jgi:hypothetical protein
MLAGVGIDAGRMIGTEFPHQHRFAHSGVAKNCDRGHSRCARVVEDLLEELNSLLNPGVANPALRPYRAYPLMGGKTEEL